jgi:phosphate transport system permease protein
MTDASSAVPASTGSILVQSDRMARRNAAERRFRIYGLVAVVFSLGMLAFILFTIFADGVSAFRQSAVTFPVELVEKTLDPKGNRDRAQMSKVTTVGYAKLISKGFAAMLEAQGIAAPDLTDKQLAEFLSKEAAAQLRDRVLADPALIGQKVEITALVGGRIDGFVKGRVTADSAARDALVSPEQLALAQVLKDKGLLRLTFNSAFITGTDASDQRPEAAGLGVAILGSAYMMVLVILMALPVGIAASIYLEEFAPKNRWTDVIEVNISNLAAVPSIVFGILGLAIFINFAGVPQSSSLVGALVLSLMTLPTIIIATRASLKAVPGSIRDAALGVGASKMQTTFHHVLPLAVPGILTGAIIGLARALGETAPLLLIGMVAFVKEYPGAPPEGILDPASALPVQIYQWTQRSDPAFVERAAGAIIVLLVFLMLMNATAILLRRRFERRW